MINNEMGNTIVQESLGDALKKRYLTYALSTIMHRALPDIRDGLKPVHRRILYAMHELRLSSKSSYRKSAKISGDVMGNYHPHGDQAIYDSLTRLAQKFNLRYPLIDGQGNFGNIDGDNPASARYTEARITLIAETMLEGLSEDTVDFRQNYDDSLTEPVVLPASFPNLLANGTSGIAVGMATNIPPHNIEELCRACIRMIDFPKTNHEDLLKDIPAPDFPTGGILIESSKTILAAYKNGRGTLRLRAKWHIENIGRGCWQIVVTEIPYQVQKSRLIEKIAELILQKKIPILTDIRDESTEKIRLILHLRSKSVDAKRLMETLFRYSNLEVRFNLNMNALLDGRVPHLCSLRRILKEFLRHRHEVFKRRTNYRCKKIKRRLEILAGYIIVFLNIKQVIVIIRNSDNVKAELISEFTLTETQAEAILNIRLRALRRLDAMELHRENKRLQKEHRNLTRLLKNEKLQWCEIKKELEKIIQRFGKHTKNGARRTKIMPPPKIESLSLTSMVQSRPISIIYSTMGWIRAIKGNLDDTRKIKYRAGDKPRFILQAQTTDKLLIFTSNGRFYTLACNNLPSGRTMGDPLRTMINMPDSIEVTALFVYNPRGRLLLVSSAGDGFIVFQSSVLAQTRNGKQVLNMKGVVRVLICRAVYGDMVASIGKNRKLLIFPLTDLPEMARGKGVRLQKFKNSFLHDATTFSAKKGLQWLNTTGRMRTVKNIDTWCDKRNSNGRLAPHGFPRDNRFNL